MNKTASNLNLFTYLRALCSDWLTAMCGVLSVPFGAIAVWWAHAASVKLLWVCLAVLAFLMAGFRVWRKERTERTKEVEKLKEEMSSEIHTLRSEIATLKRKPYDEQLGRQAEAMIAQLSPEGKLLLRHLLTNEPIEVGRRFKVEISLDIQVAQMAIAYGSGIVRHNEVRAGSGMIIRTEYIVSPQFRPVLQDLLYSRG